MTSLAQQVAQLRTALEAIIDHAQAHVDEYHRSMKGYRQPRHDALDAEMKLAREALANTAPIAAVPPPDATARQEGDWRPIETAPKDGTLILSFPHYIITSWNGHGWRNTYVGDGYEPDDKNYWTYCNPTHWIAIQPPPNAARRDEGGGDVG